MAEWVVEAGIGEDRAALIEGGAIVEAMIAPHDMGPRVGAICEARLTAILVKGQRGIATLDDGTELLIEPLPKSLTEGARCRLEVTRGAIPEPGKRKRAKGRISDAEIGAGVSWPAGTGADLEEYGWSELLEEAAAGEISFVGGALRIALTPAMTLIDIDGTMPPEALAIAGAAAAARAIRRMGIAGSIGIDLPTIGGRVARIAAAEAFDAVLPLPFERTAVNGFGFMQIVRPRVRASLPELFQYEPAASHARALLRRAERSGVIGASVIIAAPTVIAVIERHPDWLASLGAKLGGAVTLRGDPGRAISSGDVSQAR